MLVLLRKNALACVCVYVCVCGGGGGGGGGGYFGDGMVTGRDEIMGIIIVIIKIVLLLLILLLLIGHTYIIFLCIYTLLVFTSVLLS